MPAQPANPKSVTPHSSFAPDSLAAHLFSLELALLDPAVRHDRARVESLLAKDFQEFGSSGKIWSRNQILDLLETEPGRLITAHDFVCYSIAEGVALVTYRAVTIDPHTSEPLTTLRSSLWICVTGQWKIRFHQGTREKISPD
jgi:hypothetical protein